MNKPLKFKPCPFCGEATVAIETAWNRRAAAPAKNGDANNDQH